MNPTSVSFAGNSLQTANIITAEIDHESLPTKDDTLYPLAHASKSAIPFVSYPNKPIKLSGTIIATTKQLFEAQMDLFRSYFTNTSGNLTIGYNGATRTYIATVDKLPVIRPTGFTMATWEADFNTTLPWGLDGFTTNLYTSSGTAQSFQQALTYSGTAPWQAPIATFTMQTMSGRSNQSISWGNAYTGQQATVTRNWLPGDVVVFDSTLDQVTVNGNIVQFSGALPKFQPGAGTFTYSDTFTTRSYLYSLQYIVRYF